MERIQSLKLYQKAILLFMTAMVLVFAVLYSTTISRVGFLYKGAILVPGQESGNTVYSGEIQGKPARFTVFADKSVEFLYGDTSYGPYIVREDSSAIPKDNDLSKYMVGIELHRGEEIVFRGGVFQNGEQRWLYNEDGSMANLAISVTTSNGIMMDANGNVIDPMEPSVSTILKLMDTPELTHKGSWIAWLGGVLICVIAAVTILFADELFRWNLSLLIRNTEDAEPSDWEIASRYIGWICAVIMAMILFVQGLQ